MSQPYSLGPMIGYLSDVPHAGASDMGVLIARCRSSRFVTSSQFI